MTVRVLVVDDEPDVESSTFRRETREVHCTIEFALSDEAALGKLAGRLGEEVSLLVSDIKMPSMSGLDLLPMVKERRPDFPVFMMSDFGDTDTVATAMARGANECFTKPVDFPKLKQDIKAAMSDPRGHG